MEKVSHIYCLYFPLFLLLIACQIVPSVAQRTTVDVGVLLDLASPSGEVGRNVILLALEDFYALNPNYFTRLSIHVKDSKQGDISAAVAAIDLLKTFKVQAIIGPKTSTQAKFVSDLGNQTNTPIISYSATSPTLSSYHTPFFLRTTFNDSSQIGAITAIVTRFGWREAVPVYEDSEFGMGVIPYLVDCLQEIDTHVPYRSIVNSYATDEQIDQELLKLKTMQTRLFIVHMMPSLASRLFVRALENEMMGEGYVWIITDSIANELDSVEESVIMSMQGVIGVRPYIESTSRIANFTEQLKSKLRQANPKSDPFDLTVYDLWAYDTVFAVAMAVEHAHLPPKCDWISRIGDNSTDLGQLGICKTGMNLLNVLWNTSFDGLAGKFGLVDGQLQSSNFEIVNVIGKSYQQIGFWNPKVGITNTSSSTTSSALKPVIWPGHSTVTPRGWQIPTAGRKLKILVPLDLSLHRFVNIERNRDTNRTTFSGYSIDVFDAVMASLPYYVPYEYVALDDGEGLSSFTFNDLVYKVYLKEYDAFVGDVTIIANRSLYVDFTMPYSETGVQMLVPVRDNQRISMWIFLKPLKNDLWLAIALLFVLTGFIVWLIEHRNNEEFGGTRKQQLLNISFFSFFTFFGVPKERVFHNLSRFAVINWMLVAWVLEKNYSASLTSMMTVRQLQPTISTVNELIRNGEFVGYQHKSFVKDLLISLSFDESKLKSFSAADQYVEPLAALQKGSKNGGIAAFFDEIPYLKVVLSEHCNQYTMAGRILKTGGFGFVFQKGSPLVPDISRAILNVTEGDKLAKIERAWFGDQVACSTDENTINSETLDLHSFRGVFLITAVLWGIALTISALTYLHKFFGNNKSATVSSAEIFPTHKECEELSCYDEEIVENKQDIYDLTTGAQPISMQSSAHQQKICPLNESDKLIVRNLN